MNGNSWTLTTVFQLVNARYENMRPIVVTSQYAPASLAKGSAWRENARARRQSPRASPRCARPCPYPTSTQASEGESRDLRAWPKCGLAPRAASARSLCIHPLADRPAKHADARHGRGGPHHTDKRTEPPCQPTPGPRARRCEDRRGAREEVPGEQLTQARRRRVAGRPVPRGLPLRLRHRARHGRARLILRERSLGYQAGHRLRRPLLHPAGEQRRRVVTWRLPRQHWR